MALQGQVRGFSFGGELTQLGGLARLGGTSPSLRNSYENIMYSYEKWGRLPMWDLTSFAGIPPRWDENFPHEHEQVGQRGKVDRVFFI